MLAWSVRRWRDSIQTGEREPHDDQLPYRSGELRRRCV
jgi:hypothetical protein